MTGVLTQDGNEVKGAIEERHMNAQDEGDHL